MKLIDTAAGAASSKALAVKLRDGLHRPSRFSSPRIHRRPGHPEGGRHLHGQKLHGSRRARRSHRISDHGETRHTVSAYMTFVALDKSGKPIAIPPLILETPEEQRRNREAQSREGDATSGKDKRESVPAQRRELRLTTPPT